MRCQTQTQTQGPTYVYTVAVAIRWQATGCAKRNVHEGCLFAAPLGQYVPAMRRLIALEITHGEPSGTNGNREVGIANWMPYTTLIDL